MNSTEYKKQEQELKRRIDLEYLKISEEMKQAICNIERKVKENTKDEDTER